MLVFVYSTILSMISLSKYKWKVSSMFPILLALECRAWQLIPSEMVSHFRCVPVATGCSKLHQFFGVFCLSLGQDNHKVLPKHHLCLYIQLFLSNEVSMSIANELFSWPVSLLLIYIIYMFFRLLFFL